jgi:hypothetical protein
MKGYSDWLNEAVGAKLAIKLSRKDAEAVLGLSGDWSKDDLKKAVRLAKSRAHPDKGGSAEEFNKVQAAEKTLSGSTGQTNGRVDWDDINRQYQELYQQVMAELKGMMKPENFVKYFSDLFGEKFDSNMHEMGATRGRSTPSYAGLHFEFANGGRTKVFEFDVHVSLHDVRHDKTKAIGGTADTLAYTVGITAYGYVNKRKVKMSQRDYSRSNSLKALQDPSVAFPKSKVTKDQKARKFSRRDMELFLKKELKAEIGTYIYIPTQTDNMYIWMDRGTFMRTPYWQVSIWEKTGMAYKSASRMYATFPETEDTADLIKQASKMSAQQAEKFLQAEYEKWKKANS